MRGRVFTRRQQKGGVGKKLGKTTPTRRARAVASNSNLTVPYLNPIKQEADRAGVSPDLVHRGLRVNGTP